MDTSKNHKQENSVQKNLCCGDERCENYVREKDECCGGELCGDKGKIQK